MIDGIFDNGSEPGELETVDAWEKNQEPAIFFQEKEEYNLSLADGVSYGPPNITRLLSTKNSLRNYGTSSYGWSCFSEAGKESFRKRARR